MRTLQLLKRAQRKAVEAHFDRYGDLNLSTIPHLQDELDLEYSGKPSFAQPLSLYRCHAGCACGQQARLIRPINITCSDEDSVDGADSS